MVFLFLREKRRRWHVLRRKFIRLHGSNHIQKALDVIRHDSYSDELVETGAEMRERVSKECAW